MLYDELRTLSLLDGFTDAAIGASLAAGSFAPVWEGAQ